MQKALHTIHTNQHPKRNTIIENKRQKCLKITTIFTNTILE